MNERYVTVREAAPRLHLSDRRVRQKLQAGELLGVKPGRSWLIPEAALRESLGESGLEAELLSTADADLGPHARELFHFGRRLRDRLRMPVLTDALDPPGARRQPPLWSGRPVVAEPTRDDEERNVDGEWPFTRYDARSHSLFQYFREHLADSPCWHELSTLTAAIVEYHQHASEVRRQAEASITSVLPSANADDLWGMLYTLLVDAHHRASGTGGLSVSYEPVQEGSIWRLRLGAVTIGSEDRPQALSPLADVHRSLTEEAAEWKSVRALRKAATLVRAAAGRFQRELHPDARLRKLLLHSRCSLCP